MCTKVKFDSKDLADQKIREINYLAQKSNIPTRSYLCPRCNKYHLTSKSKTEQKGIEYNKRKKQERKIENLSIFWAKRKGWNLED